jgi:imidazolonepropionase-like amidohydrolase
MMAWAPRSRCAGSPFKRTMFSFEARDGWILPGELKDPVVIQVTGDRIARVIADGNFDRKTAGGTWVDLGAATILPGLMDAHVHLQIGGARVRTRAPSSALGSRRSLTWAQPRTSSSD